MIVCNLRLWGLRVMFVGFGFIAFDYFVLARLDVWRVDGLIDGFCLVCACASVAILLICRVAMACSLLVLVVCFTLMT